MLKNVASPAFAGFASYGAARTSLQRELVALRCSATSSVAVAPESKPRRPQADTRRALACTHYLVFKEPTADARSSGRGALPQEPSLREPSNVTRRPGACQPLSRPTQPAKILPCSAPAPRLAARASARHLWHHPGRGTASGATFQSNRAHPGCQAGPPPGLQRADVRTGAPGAGQRRSRLNGVAGLHHVRRLSLATARALPLPPRRAHPCLAHSVSLTKCCSRAPLRSTNRRPAIPWSVLSRVRSSPIRLLFT
jgi:hypothetical protein